MTPRTYSNIAVATTLASGITALDGSLTVADATGYPAAPFAIVVDAGSVTSEEVILVTAKAGAVFTVTRAYDGTTAKAHSAGASVIHAAIADDFRGMQLGTREVSSAAPALGQALVWNNTTSVWEPGTISGGASGLAGGVLSGTYPNPGFAVDMATQAELNAHEADTTSVHGIADTSQIALKNAANVFTVKPQKIQTVIADANPDLFANRLGVGSIAETDAYFAGRWERNTFGIGETFQAGSSGAYISHSGLNMLLRADYRSGTDENQETDGLSFQVDIPATATVKPYWISGMFGIVSNSSDLDVYQGFGAYLSAANYSTGSFSEMVGLWLDNQNYGDVCALNEAILITTPSVGSGITENYGIRINDQNVGTTLSYAIHTNGGAHRLGDYVDLAEISTPAAPSNTHGRLFCRDVAGKTQLCVRFATGAVAVLAAEP